MNVRKMFNDQVGVSTVGLSREHCLELITQVASEVGLNAAYLYYIIAETSDSCKELVDDEGYIILDSVTLNDLTSLSRAQQNIAVDRLLKSGYVDVKKKGVPATKCFKILK